MISDISLPFISYSDVSPWILSYLLSYRSLIITFFYPSHLTMAHDLTPFSIMRRCRSVLDHLGCAFIYLLDFRFNIFHDGRTWQIVDLLVMMFSLWQLACWVLICLLFAFWALVIICFYSLVSFVLLAWYRYIGSYLALPIWSWTFSLHDGWTYFRGQ